MLDVVIGGCISVFVFLIFCNAVVWCDDGVFCLAAVVVVVVTTSLCIPFLVSPSSWASASWVRSVVLAAVPVVAGVVVGWRCCRRR